MNSDSEKGRYVHVIVPYEDHSLQPIINHVHHLIQSLEKELASLPSMDKTPKSTGNLKADPSVYTGTGGLIVVYYKIYQCFKTMLSF